MTNPFDNDSEQYFVLINHEGQHSLWPLFVEIPEGWTTGFGPDGRGNCLAFVNRNWTDMRPFSLIEQMKAHADSSDVRDCTCYREGGR
jgi:MbtH protein